VQVKLLLVIQLVLQLDLFQLEKLVLLVLQELFHVKIQLKVQHVLLDIIWQLEEFVLYVIMDGLHVL